MEHCHCLHSSCQLRLYVCVCYTAKPESGWIIRIIYISYHTIGAIHYMYHVLGFVFDVRLCVPLAQVGAKGCSIAPDCSPLRLAVIRQSQPGAGWPRFTVFGLCCQQGSTASPQHLQKNVLLLYSAHNSSQRIFLVLIMLRAEIHAPLYRLRTVCPSFVRRCIVWPSYIVVRLYGGLNRGVWSVWWRL